MKHLMKRAWTKYALVALVTALIVAPAVAVASHGFTDVPDTHLFHNNIQWMKDNGVTLGCNPPANDKYCPSNTVNRGQMAAFMQRLAENKVVDAKTAVTAGDSDTVDGKHAADFLGVADKAADSDLLDGYNSTAFHSYEFEVPAFQTLYGAWGVGDNATALPAISEGPISFPVPFNTELVGHIINIGDPATTECPGTAAEPEAAAGNLCIYVGFSTEAGMLDGFYSAVDGGSSVSPYGVNVYLRADATGLFEATGTWAATAPLNIIIVPFSEDAAKGSGATE